MNNKEFVNVIKDGVQYFRSENYNFNYSLKNGMFERWGKTKEDDPQFSEFGPELIDCEITTICHGACKECYKDNTSNGENMSFETFKQLITKVNPNKTIGQVAFGLGMTGTENPDLPKMSEWLRSQNIIPNGTVANISEKTGEWIAKNFGACAISVHDHWKDWKNIFCNSVERITKHGMKQVNCHFVLSQKTLPIMYELIEMRQTDKRLSGLNAIVLLSIKECGRAVKNDFRRINDKDFQDLCENMIDMKMNIGFDSCTAKRFEKFINTDKDKYGHLLQYVEPCESGLFSIYSNVKGELYNCSFGEKEEYKYDVLNSDIEFLDWWNNKNIWRKKLLENGRACPLYNI